VAATVGAAMENVRAAADAKGVDFSATVDPGVGSISGDGARLQQVVWNLLSNAVKFTPRGGRVDLRAERGDGELRMTVADTGEGIAPEFLPHVFERFRQADSSSTRTHTGLGLGLAIVRHLVELHGGSVRVASAGKGGGTTFTVRLPATSASAGAAPRAAATITRSGMPIPTLASKRILVLDDERDARDAIATVLELCGAQVVAVSSVADAVARISGEAPDAIVSDIAMPTQDGFALIRQLRGLAGASRVPAIALTAYASAEDQRRILAAGFDAYLTKPIDATELVATIARLTRA
jgi:CheY-like chemotaxis protein